MQKKYLTQEEAKESYLKSEESKEFQELAKELLAQKLKSVKAYRKKHGY